MLHEAALPRFARAASALAMLILTAGCASVRPVPSDRPDGLEPGGLVLTSQDVHDLGARDAMEAIERAPTYLNIQRVRNGDPVRITQRGVGSFVLSPEILVVVDGARVSSPVNQLESIPAASIRFIQILNAREATAKWGSEAGNGVILVQTSAGR